MLTTKFRATCAAVSTVLTIAVAIGPMAPLSQAAPNTGHGPSKLSKDQCQTLQDLANSDSDTAASEYAAGHTAMGRAFQNLADDDYEAARKGGCAWAIWRVLPRSGPGSTGGRTTVGS
jgi:hypothetical protein